MNRTDEMHQAKLNRMYNTTKPHSFVRLGITCRECGNLEGHPLHEASALARTAASAQKQSPASQTQAPSPPDSESPDAAAKAEGSQEDQS